MHASGKVWRDNQCNKIIEELYLLQFIAWPLIVSECWMFYAVPTARVIFTAKTSVDVFSLRQEHVWTFSVLSD